MHNCQTGVIGLPLAAAPDLHFAIEAAEAVECAAVPTIAFRVAIENRTTAQVQSVSLNAQVRISPGRRAYADDERQGLVELFGRSEQWGQSARGLFWTHASAQAPAFDGRTTVELPVTCTYDLEVIATKYLQGLEGGVVPLEFLFSGTVFYCGETGLQVARIPWDREARFDMPVSLWQQTMDHYFPNSAWLRLSRDVFDRLYRYRAANGLLTWEAAIGRLLDSSSRVAGGPPRLDGDNA